MWESILTYLGKTLAATFTQIGILLVPVILGAIIVNLVTAFIQRRAINIMGQRWYLGLFGWLGTVVHELGHALFCLIFLHKITDIKLFYPDPETGTLGYVKHSYNSSNIYQVAGNFFIGIGPILLCTAIIYLLANWLLGLNLSNIATSSGIVSSQLNSWDGLQQVLQNVWNTSGSLFTNLFTGQNLSGWQLYVFIYLVFALGCSLTLSLPDIKGALQGFFWIVILVFMLNLATLWKWNLAASAVIGISSYSVLLYAVVFLIILLNIAVAILILLPLSLLRQGH